MTATVADGQMWHRDDQKPRDVSEMADSVVLNGVRTWYDERGDGEPLVLLHGGLVDARFFEKNIDPLSARPRKASSSET